MAGACQRGASRLRKKDWYTATLVGSYFQAPAVAAHDSYGFTTAAPARKPAQARLGGCCRLDPDLARPAAPTLAAGLHPVTERVVANGH